VICIFIYVGIESGLAFYADTVFTVGLGVPAFGAFAISLYWAAMGGGRFYFGRIKKLPDNLPAKFLFLLTPVVIAIALCGQEIIMLALFLASGFACSCIWPGIVNAAIALDREVSGKIMSYLVLGGGLGGALLPLVMGMIIDSAGIPAAFLILAGLSVITGIYMWQNTVKSKRHFAEL
jgi:fucose permease